MFMSKFWHVHVSHRVLDLRLLNRRLRVLATRAKLMQKHRSNNCTNQDRSPDNRATRICQCPQKAHHDSSCNTHYCPAGRPLSGPPDSGPEWGVYRDPPAAIRTLVRYCAMSVDLLHRDSPRSTSNPGTVWSWRCGSDLSQTSTTPGQRSL